MIRESVTSSNINSIGYDQKSQILEIEFHHGEIYQYYGVDNNLYKGLMSAQSHGTFFHQHIKSRYGDTKIY